MPNSKSSPQEDNPEVKRKADDPLLGALSLVLEANHDYAKSVSSLLSTDLSQGQSLVEIKERLKVVGDKTDELLVSQEKLLNLLEELPELHKQKFIDVTNNHEKGQKKYLDAQFSKIYLALGLKPDGNEHGEADSFILKMKSLFSKQVISVIVGMLAYNIALWLINYFQSGGKIYK